MKNRTFKKTLAAFLCLVLMFSTVAVGASAVDFTAPSDMFLISKTESKIEYFKNGFRIGNCTYTLERVTEV